MQWQGKDVLYEFLKDIPQTFKGFKLNNTLIHMEQQSRLVGSIV